MLDTQMRVYDDSSLTPPCSLDKSVVGNLPSPPEKSTFYLEVLIQRIPSPVATLRAVRAGPSVFVFTFCSFYSAIEHSLNTGVPLTDSWAPVVPRIGPGTERNWDQSGSG